MTDPISTARPRRSVLYMPGSNARALDKAKTIAADALILDLEDAVAPDAKETARKQVVDAVKAGGYGKRELIVRINGFDVEWGHFDMPSVSTSGADAILLPKVESADQIFQAENLMNKYGAPASMTIMAMIETPRGVLYVNEIAKSTARLSCLVMGTSDLSKDLHARHTKLREPMLTSLSLCLLAARAYDLAILDGVHLDLNDDDGFEASCVQGLELGFDGKTLIHPKQVDAANRVFAPSAEEIAWSKKIIDAFEAAEKDGKGVVLVDGKLIENLHVTNARRLVATAEAIAALEQAA